MMHMMRLPTFEPFAMTAVRKLFWHRSVERYIFGCAAPQAGPLEVGADHGQAVADVMGSFEGSWRRVSG
jgi:hypothetical protein